MGMACLSIDSENDERSWDSALRLQLQSCLDSDKVDTDIVSETLRKMKRLKETKALHKAPIHYTEASKWFTTVEDPTRKNHRRIIKRATEQELWESLDAWYHGEREVVTLQTVYPKWLKEKEMPNNAENIKRLKASWQAYYLKEPLSRDIINSPLSDLTPIKLHDWAEEMLRKHYPVDQQKFSRIFGIAAECLDYAAYHQLGGLTATPWPLAKSRITKGLITRKPTPADEDQVFTEEERLELWRLVYEDLERYPRQASSAGLQILFIMETGLRIGEACGLKWSDIRKGRLYVRRQATNEGVKDFVKTASGYRDIHLTPEVLKILDDVRQFNEDHGFTREWVFQSSNEKYDGRLSYNACDRKLRKLCARMDTPIKSPHKLRKTCISKLLDDKSINERTVQHMAGHADLSTTHQYYHYCRQDKAQQEAAIDNLFSLDPELLSSCTLKGTAKQTSEDE